MGKGSNCLFDDQGFDGCVILNCIRFLEEIDDGLFRVGSGYPFNTLGVEMAKRGFSGLEFAGGIPGTVGGAVFMNAGAQSQVIVLITFLDFSQIIIDRQISGDFPSSTCCGSCNPRR